MEPVAEEQKAMPSLPVKSANVQAKGCTGGQFSADLLATVGNQRLKGIGGGFEVGEVAADVILDIGKERVVLNFSFMPVTKNCRVLTSIATISPVNIQESRIFRPDEEERLNIDPYFT